MKNINLIPTNIRYDYEKFYIIRLIILTLSFNILLLLIIVINENLILSSLKQQLNEKKQYLQNITQLNSNFKKYDKEYSRLKKYLNESKEKEKTFLSYYKKDYSPLVSTLIHLDAIKEGIFINTFSYSNGYFVINGTVNNNKTFYNYYKSLENNPYIAELDFSNLTANKEQNNFNFDISFKVRKINEIF
jgi:hypothetical protein